MHGCGRGSGVGEGVAGVVGLGGSGAVWRDGSASKADFEQKTTEHLAGPPPRIRDVKESA